LFYDIGIFYNRKRLHGSLGIWTRVLSDKKECGFMKKRIIILFVAIFLIVTAAAGLVFCKTSYLNQAYPALRDYLARFPGSDYAQENILIRTGELAGQENKAELVSSYANLLSVKPVPDGTNDQLYTLMLKTEPESMSSEGVTSDKTIAAYTRKAKPYAFRITADFIPEIMQFTFRIAVLAAVVLVSVLKKKGIKIADAVTALLFTGAADIVIFGFMIGTGGIRMLGGNIHGYLSASETVVPVWFPYTPAWLYWLILNALAFAFIFAAGGIVRRCKKTVLHGIILSILGIETIAFDFLLLRPDYFRWMGQLYYNGAIPQKLFVFLAPLSMICLAAVAALALVYLRNEKAVIPNR